MTALDRYIRLEAVGLWQEAPETPSREVVVSFGRTTLLFSDLAERPLGHWTLGGIEVLRREPDATVYAMGTGETLTIRDQDMIAAIAAVPRGQLRGPSAPVRRPRVPIGLLAALAALAAAVLFVPDLIRAQAVRMVPPEQAAEFGDRMLITLIEAGGAPCDEPAGRRALARLAERLDPAAPPRLQVLELAAPVAALPGRTVLLDRDALTAATAPDEVAGWVALALGRDPLDALLRAAGLARDLRYVLSGEVAEAALARAALAAPSPAAPEEAVPTLTRLKAAGFDPAPFAARFGLSVPASAAPVPPFPDQDWVALQGICG